jgi:hypothetical protein
VDSRRPRAGHAQAKGTKFGRPSVLDPGGWARAERSPDLVAAAKALRPLRHANKPPPLPRSAGIRLNRLHVVVGQAEMMPDLVDQHMGDNSAERLLMVAASS